MRRKRLTIKPIDRIEGLKTYANLLKEELEWFKEEALQNARKTAENLLNQLISDLNDFKEIQKLLDNKKLQAREKEEQLQAQLKKFNFQVLNDLRRIVSALVRSPMYRRERDYKANTYFVRYVTRLNDYPKAEVKTLLSELAIKAMDRGIEINAQGKVTSDALTILNPEIPRKNKLSSIQPSLVLLEQEDDEKKEEVYPTIKSELCTLIERRNVRTFDKEGELLQNLLDSLEQSESEFKANIRSYLNYINNNPQQEKFAKELLKLIAQVDMTYVESLCKEDLDAYCRARKQEAENESYFDLKYHHHGFFGKVLGAFGFGISAAAKITAAKKISNYIEAKDWDRSAGLTGEDFDALTDSRLGGIMHFYDEIGIFSGSNIFEKEDSLKIPNRSL